MKLCRCLSEHLSIFSILWGFIALSQFSYVQSVTTAPPDTTTILPPTTTTTLPPTTTTTLPPTTTTTLPPTTTIAPDQPRSVIGDTAIGQCLCDLTGNKCDINCCCDTDCSAADILAFQCDLRSIRVDDKLCYPEDVFPFSNSPATTTTDGGLFCIYYDNYNERNYYLDPDFILDIPSFNDYVGRYATPALQEPVSIVEPVYDLNSFYEAGDTVYIIYPSDARGTFVLPTSSLSNQCNDQNTISYLNEVNSECSRIISTLTDATCTNTVALDATSYYLNFRVVKTSGLFGYVENGTFIGIATTTPVPAPTTTAPAATTVPPTASNTTDNSTTVSTTPAPTTTAPTSTPVPTTTALPTTVDPNLIQTLYNNPYTLEIDSTTLTHLCRQGDGSLADCTFPSIPSPTFAAATCSNVVQEVRYFVTTDGTNGINKMQVQFVFRDIVATNLPLTQTYSVSYNSLTDSNNTFVRSGNPGYMIGKPLLYGILNVTVSAENVESQVVEIATDSSLGLTLVRASATGECSTSTSSRIPVRFGENMRTGCLIRLTLPLTQTVCQDIQTTIVETLEGPNVPVLNQDGTAWVDNNRYVATFGNTGPLMVGDWVKVIANNRPLPSSAQLAGTNTCKVRMGLHIQVLYANVGALANPQAKVIGVVLLYDSVQDVKFRCVGAFCQATVGLSQAFEVSHTVSFVDVSQPAAMFAGEMPIFIAKIPNDFFYPFLYYTNASPTINTTPHTIPLIFSVLLTMFMNLRLFVS